MTRPIKGFAEQDAFTSWKHYYCYIRRAGVKAAIKRLYRQRERRENKIMPL